jgi:hypothetical protein
VKQVTKQEHPAAAVAGSSVVLGQSSFLIGQKGVFTRRGLAAGAVAFRVVGPISAHRTQYSFQFDARSHIEPQGSHGTPPYGRYLNHSCSPNCYTRVMPQLGWIDVVTRAPLPEGTELTVDYAAMELDTVSSELCRCGAASCRVRIAGFRQLPPELQQAYLAEGIIPAYLQDAAGVSVKPRS